ncbi:MAG: DUF2079 domain-containing protein, partial [Oscillospiraceae bacterium]
IVGFYLLRDDKLSLKKLNISDKAAKIIVISFGVLFLLFVGGMTTFRYLTYSTPGFDFGIFAQMFHNMKESFLPMTTIERDGLLSHFAVHISPIFYLLLPGYCIFQSPIYLQIMQALILASAVIPLFLLAKHFNLSNKAIICVCGAFCAFPALMGGCFYDIHENKFLTPLLLWLFYFLEKNKFLGVYIFSFLTLMVKEDAAIYVATIALFIFFCKKKYKHGAIIFVASMAYFFFAVAYLNRFGDGAMTGRWGNFIPDESMGLFGMVKTVLLNPLYLISQSFTSEKIIFILLMLIPVMFLPLFSKKLSQLLLLLPFLVINLMPNYLYQHSIDFQYTYGVTAIFFYLVVVNLNEIKTPEIKKYLLAGMLISSCLLCTSRLSTKVRYAADFVKNFDENAAISAALSEIPDDASVKTTTFFTANLANRSELYEISSEHQTQYVVFDLRKGRREETLNDDIMAYKELGYEQIEFEKDLVLVLKYNNEPD